MDYAVQPGDTLWKIAARLCGDAERWRTIAADNQLLGTSRIFIGDRLWIRDSLLSDRVAGSSSARIPMPHGSVENRPSVIPARAFAYVLADEFDPFTRKIVRRVMVNPRMAAELSTTIGKRVTVVPDPERFGLRPGAAHDSPITMGRHAMNLKPSPFISASDHPLGATRFSGNSFWIDVDRARAAGATLHETSEITTDLARIASKTRTTHDLAKIEQFKRLVIADKEVLVRGSVPATAIKGATAMALTRGLQGVQVVSFMVTAIDLGHAASRSVAIGSVNPIAAESIRQVGSWAAAWAGVKLGATAGALVGIETGPVAVLFATGGAVIGGFGGYIGFDWIADRLDAN